MKFPVRLPAAYATAVLFALPVQAQPTTEPVSGTVSDPFGTPIQAAELTLDSISGYQQTTTTTANGEFGFPDVVVGSYQLAVVASGFPTAIERIVVAPDTPVTKAIILMPAVPARITVTATDPQGLVLPGVTVILNGPNGSQIEGVTESNGAFQTTSVQPGTWTADGSLPGFQPGGSTVEARYGTTSRATVALGLDYSVAEDLIVLGSTRPVGRRTEVRLVDSPVTTSVISGEAIAIAPSASFGDALRSIPGLNVVQFSARDTQITSRQSTGILANSQLVLMDGRSVYLDFFGMVLWDALPMNTDDIEQVEVIRGPASVTWGPNAMTGAVHFITKAPRDSVGTTVTMGTGLVERGSNGRSRTGFMSNTSVSVTRAPSDTLAYRISAGYSKTPPLARPVGRIPVIADPRMGSGTDPRMGGSTVGGAAYPPDQPGRPGESYANRGTSQPKFDVRIDQELDNGGQLTYSSGVGATEGVTHTGLGPFDLNRGAYLAYGKIGYTRNNLRVQAFTNVSAGESGSLLITDATRPGQPVSFGFTNRTIDLDIGHSSLIGTRHVLRYGANARHNTFDLNIAPEAPNRLEFGGYLQDELYLGPFRLVLGGRLDKFGSVSTPFFSPRVSLMYKPGDDHSLVASYNRALRSPSVIENFLQLRMVQPVDLSWMAGFKPLLRALLPPGLDPATARLTLADFEDRLDRTTSQPFPLAVGVLGSEIPTPGQDTNTLGAESLTVYELRYSGLFGSSTRVGAAAYINQSDHAILGVVLDPAIDPYTADAPPDGWLLPPQILAYLAADGIFLPRTSARFANRGGTRNLGTELWLDQGLSPTTAVKVSYSWQNTPSIRETDEPYPASQLSLPPTHRFSATLSTDSRRFLGSAAVTAATRAFWADVLTPEYHGYSPGYMSIDGAFGVKWRAGTVTTSIKVTNMLNRSIQQHIFGDILGRTVLAELRFRL